MISILLAVAALAGLPPMMRTTGDIHVNVERGLLEGSVCIDNFPAAAGKTISLHGGLNLAHVRDGQGTPRKFEGWYDAAADGEGRLYDVDMPEEGPVCFDYVGAVPVFRDLDAAEDFKGLIADDGKSIRASEQSVWLPTPYDRTNKRRLQVTAFRLHVKCDDCTMLYLNGAAPVSGADAILESAVPRPPFLFAAQGVFDTGKAVTFINVQPKPDSSAAFDALFRDLRRYYAGYLGLQFKDTPVVLRFVSLERAFNPKHRWGFATWPTIAFGNGDIDEMGATLATNDLSGQRTVAYLAHETAHYYFGTVIQPTANYRWLLVESAAEFMSIKALAALRGEDAKAAKISPMIAGLKKAGLHFKPLDQVSSPEQIDGNYRYTYAPLLLLTLEKAVGENRMQAFMRGLLSSPEPKNWEDMTAIALKAEISEPEWRDWTARCVEGPQAPCIEALQVAAK